MWTDEDLEEMGYFEPWEKAMFLSGCDKHKLCNATIEGYIISEEKLKKFAELIIAQYEKHGGLNVSRSC